MPIKILYVEDEVFLAKIVAESLETRDYEVRWISDGALAMEEYETFKPDICVLDVMLPNKDGFEIGREIRELSPTMPIIFLTAKSQTSDVVEGFSSGGNDYLKKPFSMEELIVRIENILALMSEGARSFESGFEFGQFSFDPLRMELIHGDSVKKLSHRENELLKMLVEHRNRPVERRKILKDLWGDDSFFNSRNLDVYITRLRKYLKEDPDVQINTLKGVGYQFVTV